MSDTDFITESWGIWCRSKNEWLLCFGDPDYHAVCGRRFYKKRRRAKKEITHYLERGLCDGPFHGAFRFLREQEKAAD